MGVGWGITVIVCRRRWSGACGSLSWDGSVSYPAQTHLIRRSGQVVQDRPSLVVGWADISQLSTYIGRCPAAWQQCWQQLVRLLVIGRTVQGMARVRSGQAGGADMDTQGAITGADSSPLQSAFDCYRK